MPKLISAVDIFCGVGGLTYGFVLEGIRVTAGIDVDPACQFPFENNNPSCFFKRDVEVLDSEEVLSYFPRSDLKLLAGCAPCQPFSTYTQGRENYNDEKWGLLYSFGRIIKSVRPEIVTMENVPKLVKHQVFIDFVNMLKSLDYHVTIYPEVDCPSYGIPQTRTRLVLFASIFGEIKIESPSLLDSSSFKTVRETIGHLPPIKAGEVSTTDPLHRTSKLSEKNLKRMQTSRPGGTWRDWDKRLRANCHKKESGRSYPSVYGRMKWDEPAPTVTTQFYGFGNGRFGHPEQDRALSLREGAMLQTFPEDYAFVAPDQPVHIKRIGRLIGNAVPVELARVIARSITKHVEKYNV